MTYGLRTWNDEGVLEMDTDSFTYQVIHNQLYRLGPQGNGLVIVVPIPGFNPSTCVATLLPTQAAPNTYAVNAMPYMAVYSGGVTLRAIHPDQPSGLNEAVTAIQVRLLVMRYRN